MPMGAAIYIPSLNHYSELPDSYTQLPSDISIQTFLRYRKFDMSKTELLDLLPQKQNKTNFSSFHK